MRQTANVPLERIVPTTVWSETFGTRSRWDVRRGRIGIATDQGEIQAMSVRGGVPEWAGLVEVVDGHLAVTLTRLLIWLRVQQRRPASIRIALGPAAPLPLHRAREPWCTDAQRHERRARAG